MIIKAKNFMSWENLEFKVVDGVTLIQGFNNDDNTPEGSGKSAILNALSWGLYGKIPKDAKVDDVIRKGTKSCIVEIELEKCTVVRSRNPNDLVLKVNNTNEEIKGKDSRETQTIIEEYIGLSFETFCQSVYFAQNYPNKFITANQENKGKILSEIQNLKQFDVARKITQEKLKNLKDPILIAEKDIEKYQALLKAENTNGLNISNAITEFTEEKEERINNFKLEIEKLTIKKEEKEKQLNSAIKDNSRHNIEEVKSEVEAVEKEITIVMTDRLEVNNEINSIEEKKKDLVKLENDLVRKVKDNATLKRNIYRNSNDTEKLTKRITDCEGLIKTYENDIEKLTKEIQNPEPRPCPTCENPWNGDTTKLNEKLNTYLDYIKGEEQEIIDYKKTIKEKTEENNELNEDLEMYVKEVERLQKEIKEFKVPNYDDLEKLLSNINKTIKDHDENLEEYNSFIRRYSETEKEIEWIKTSIEEVYASIVESKKTLESEKKKKPVELNRSLENSNNKAKDLAKKIKDETNGLGKLKENQAKLEILKDGFREVKIHVFHSILNELSRKANSYLTELFEVPIKIKFENNDMKIGVEVNIDGDSRPLGLFSGGQFRRICLAVDLALSEITLDRKGSSLNLLILDEYFKDLSEVSMEKVLRLLERRNSPVLLIEHNSLFKAIVNNTFEVELIDGVSKTV